MARLAGEVEKKMLAAQKLREAVPVAHVGHVDRHFAPESVEVAAVAAVFRDEAVEDRDLGAAPHERASQVRADEPETAGDEHALAAKGRGE